MARSGFQEFKRGDRVLIVQFQYLDGFTDVAIEDAHDRETEKAVAMTDAEQDRFARWIMEHRSTQDQYDNAADAATYDAT